MGQLKKVLVIRVSEAEKELLVRRCKEQGRTQSDLIRELIRGLEDEQKD